MPLRPYPIPDFIVAHSREELTFIADDKQGGGPSPLHAFAKRALEHLDAEDSTCLVGEDYYRVASPTELAAKTQADAAKILPVIEPVPYDEMCRRIDADKNRKRASRRDFNPGSSDGPEQDK